MTAFLCRCSLGLALVALLAPRQASAADLLELPRSDVVAAYYLGLAAGLVSLDTGTEKRAAAGNGIAVGLTLGLAFAHEFPVNFGFGSWFFEDRQPFSEWVVTCSSYEGVSLGCGDAEEQESKVVGNYVSLDGGYQPRIQFAKGFALLPGALVGYLWNSGTLERSVGCDGCKSIPISGAEGSGMYVAPALRMVLGRQQFFAFSVRSQWFITGGLKQMTLFGFEFLAP